MNNIILKYAWWGLVCVFVFLLFTKGINFSMVSIQGVRCIPEPNNETTPPNNNNGGFRSPTRPELKM